MNRPARDWRSTLNAFIGEAYLKGWLKCPACHCVAVPPGTLTCTACTQHFSPSA